MFSITNEKVAGFDPRWAAFRGFSVLFDNPGDGFVHDSGVIRLACNVDRDTSPGFYKALRDGLNRLNLNLLTSTYLFCPLPPPSYHVTVWDGGNDGNLAQITVNQRPQFEEFLSQLPGSVGASHAATEMALSSRLVYRHDWDIELKFDRLAIWGSVIAALLTPVESAHVAFDEMVAERTRLNNSFREAFGIGASVRYTPHVSLGYFANREGGQLAKGCSHEWNEVIAEHVQDQTLRFSRASVYGFTDMANFFKAAEPGMKTA